MYPLSCDWVKSYFHRDVPCSGMVLELVSKGRAFCLDRTLWYYLDKTKDLKATGNSVVFTGFFSLTCPIKTKLGSTREGTYDFFSDFFVFLYHVGRVDSLYMLLSGDNTAKLAMLLQNTYVWALSFIHTLCKMNMLIKFNHQMPTCTRFCSGDTMLIDYQFYTHTL